MPRFISTNKQEGEIFTVPSFVCCHRRQKLHLNRETGKVCVCSFVEKLNIMFIFLFLFSLFRLDAGSFLFSLGVFEDDASSMINISVENILLRTVYLFIWLLFIFRVNMKRFLAWKNKSDFRCARHVLRTMKFDRKILVYFGCSIDVWTESLRIFFLNQQQPYDTGDLRPTL